MIEEQYLDLESIARSDAGEFMPSFKNNPLEVPINDMVLFSVEQIGKPVKPLKFEIIYALMTHSNNYSENEICQVKITNQLLMEAEQNTKKKTALLHREERRKQFIELEASFKETFFEKPSLIYTKNHDQQEIRKLLLPDYQLKNFEKIRMPEWKQKIEKFLFKYRVAIEQLPTFWHTTALKSAFSQLSECYTQKERHKQAVLVFYCLKYKNDAAHFVKIDKILCQYTKHTDLDMLLALNAINEYFYKKKLKNKPFYQLYLKYILSESSQTKLLQEDHRVEQELEKKTRMVFEQKMDQYDLIIERQNQQIQELGQSNSVQKVKELEIALQKAIENLSSHELKAKELETKCQMLSHKIDELAFSNNELQKQCDFLIEKNNQLFVENKSLKEENSSLKQDKSSLEEELRQAKNELSNTQQTALRLENEVRLLKEHLLHKPPTFSPNQNNSSLSQLMQTTSSEEENDSLFGSCSSQEISIKPNSLTSGYITFEHQGKNKQGNFFGSVGNEKVERPPTNRTYTPLPQHLSQSLPEPLSKKTNETCVIC